jgi:hypothetical protein
MAPMCLPHFVCTLAAALLLSCGEASRATSNDYLVELGNSSQGEAGLHLSFTSKDCDDMRVLRQGSVVAAASCKDKLKLDAALHREYVLETSRYVLPQSGRAGLRTCSRSLFVGENTMCGAGLFSRKSQDCTPQTAKTIAGDELSKTNLVPPTDRAFGLEFEFVGRKKSSHWLFGDSGPSGLRAQVGLLGKCGQSMMSGSSGNCSSTLDCGTDQFCHKSKRCRRRHYCKDTEVIEGQCPPRMLWKWETDSSVKPLTYQQAFSAGGGMSETSGVAFELVSPPPPNL